MSPESFNAALAQRKLKAADILLIQAKRGSDADRIRAASAILRMAFIPVASPSNQCSAQPIPPSPSPREGAGGSAQRADDKPAAPDQPTPAAHPAPASPPLPLPAGEGWGEGVTTLCSQITGTSGGTPAPALSSA